MARREYSQAIPDDCFRISTGTRNAVDITIQIYFPTVTSNLSLGLNSGQTPYELEFIVKGNSSVVKYGWTKIRSDSSCIPSTDLSGIYSGHIITINVPVDSTLYLRGVNGNSLRRTYNYNKSTTHYGYLRIIASTTGSTVSGNIMYLLNQRGVNVTLGDYAFAYLFSGISSNVTSNGGNPKLNINSNFTTPATSLGTYCYYRMFSYNTTLSTIPDLPANVPANNCYQSMFEGCTGITNTSTSNKIHITTTRDSCCYAMFKNCTNSNFKYPFTFDNNIIVSTGASREIASNAFREMFSGCTSLLQTINLAQITKHGDGRVMNGLVIPEGTTTVKGYAFYRMYYGCTALTTIVDNFLNNIDIVDGSYAFYGMFQNCTALNLKNNGTISFKGGALTGTISKSAYDNPVVFTSNASYCCAYMFYGCTSIGTMYSENGTNTKSYAIRTLPARVLPGNCYNSMFYGCTNLDIAPEILAVDIVSYGGTSQFYRMYYNCPSLSATWISSYNDSNNNYTLVWVDRIDIKQTDMGRSSAYYQMFYRTSSTVNIQFIQDYHTHPKAWSSTYTNNWLTGAVGTGNNSGTYSKVFGANNNVVWVNDTKDTYAIPSGFTISEFGNSYPVPKWFELGNCVMAINFDENTTTAKTDKISGNVAVGPIWYNGSLQGTPQSLNYNSEDFVFPSETDLNGNNGFKSWMGASKISGIDLSSIITSSNYSTGPEYTLMFTVTSVGGGYVLDNTLVTEKEYGKTTNPTSLECLGPHSSDLPDGTLSVPFLVICYNNSTNFYTYVIDEIYYIPSISYPDDSYSGRYICDLPADESWHKKVSTKHTFSNTWGSGATGYNGDLTNTMIYFFDGHTIHNPYVRTMYARDFRLWKGDKRKLLGIIPEDVI